MSDDRFDEWVREAAKGYNRPPDIPPRDAMWEAIVEVGGRRSEVGGSPSLDPRRSALGPRPSMLGVRPWWLAAAAMLLLAAGIGIGYAVRGRSTDTGPNVVEQPTPSGPQRFAESREPRGDSLATPVESQVRNSGFRADPGTALSAGPSATGYDVVAGQHLSAVEVLLTSFRAAEDTSMDDIMRRFARDLLSTTRLLLDSPAGANPVRRRLLVDLELVLVQMVQLPSRDGTLDRELIDRAIVRRQLLTRIRTSIPAGMPSGT